MRSRQGLDFRTHLICILRKSLIQRIRLKKDDMRTAAARPRCKPRMPSFLQVLPKTSMALVYTFFTPSLASSPWSCRRVLATSAGLETVTYMSSSATHARCQRKDNGRTAVHAATAPHIKPSTVVNGFCFLGIDAVVDMVRKEQIFWFVRRQSRASIVTSDAKATMDCCTGPGPGPSLALSNAPTVVLVYGQSI
jgi:hypothetical protein